MEYNMNNSYGRIIELLNNEYGTEYKCYLNYENAWQLLIATILSAQCTDARVNIVTERLFKKYTSIDAFANANLAELEDEIKSTGFQRNKAKNIILACKIIRDEYDGEIPYDIDKLTKLPGVGRKTANVIRGNIYNIPSIVVDTHVKRISKLLGVTKETDPVKIEYDLMKKLPQSQWILWNIHLIRLGRTICKAVKPDCANCFLREECKNKKE